MKQIAFLVTLMVYYSALAQTISHPIVEDGKMWIYKGSRLVARPEHQAEWDEIYSLEGDTIIDSRKCLKLYYTSDSFYGHYDHSYKGAFFEDDGKVYIIAHGSTTPALVYDFSCEPGTVVKFSGFELRINERKLVKYRDEYLSVIDWTPLEDKTFYHGIWIEGIGSPLDLMNATPIWYVGCPYKKLLTCTVNDEVVFDRDEYYKSAQVVTSIAKPSAPLSIRKIFDLQGCELQQAPKQGIYIQNGKKVAVN